MKGILGTKVGMTQIFDDVGNRIPVTVIRVDKNVVIQKKSAQGKDGYSAIKIGYGDIKKLEKEGKEPKWRISKPRAGVFLKAGVETPKKYVREIRVPEGELDNYEVGQELGADLFQVGEFVDATGISRGRGFTGVMARYKFGGSRASHGTSNYFRHGGSIGMSATPGRVFPGKKMAGQEGNKRATIQNLKVVGVMEEEGAILVKGAVPGANGGLVMLRSAVKKMVR